MELTWKFLVMLVFGSVVIQYIIIQSLTSTSFLMCPAPFNSSSAPFTAFKHKDQKGSMDEDPNTTRRMHVLILTATRCGSSFLGQLLNQHHNVFYLFEPLHHVQDSLTGENFLRQLTLGASRDLLWSLFQCDLYALERYMRPPPTNHMVANLFNYRISQALCQPPVCEGVKLGEEWSCNGCGQVNLTLAAQACRGKSHVVYKTVRVVVVGDVRSLLEDPRLNIKVIQLVRDPRGIINSRIEAFPGWYKPWYSWKTSGQRPPSLHVTPPFTTTCEELHSSVSTALSRPEWLKGRYMLVRYEDLARNPLQKTKEIYNFVGLTMTPSVERWVSANTKGANKEQNNNVYSTTRDSVANVENWRLKLPFEMVQHVQAECQDMLSIMGYRQVNSAQELKNMNISLVQETTFEPFL
ncbi:carbohydrate sulfotransferase 1-like [Periophthalmus magnuspinnatus]|uniref:carbohydrate sulfotransferase 1-like n=1 Tax=Periophthalmus magnuspinnatus TaxID=409849 RepID=UPI00145BDE30|nr:carbohydrate sulfotransferase 1-like [Periophthalmus magnuspinnatus]XP_055084569.1 carbohydrate sulfotransferase 1-like [Periophthalmus magnuspinnatus]